MPARVSVIIPVFNAAATLDRCLAALAAQSCHDFELIIVDNGSSDGSAAVAAGWQSRLPVPVQILHEDQRGAAAARNRGAQSATGEMLVFTDADCEPEPDWIATGLQLLEPGASQLLAGPAWGTLEGDAAARLLGLTSLSAGHDAYTVDRPDETGSSGFAAANLWLSRSLFERLGGFDVQLAVSGEDVDLCVRAFRAGVQGRFVPALRVRHIHTSGIAAMCRKMVQYGKAHALLFARYGCPGIYVDLPLLGRRRLPARTFVWCNLGSAEKKLLALLLLGCWQPWLLLLIPAYLAWLGLFLRRRTVSLGAPCGWTESVWLGALLIVKSAAMTWGRIRGSHRGVLTC
ncbi:MAG TPA: glycosyltransferase family 2 protein [Mariprofundaceae bacterium]|nr:glycosyltransferase family 2 protein [Mariprofundaceae bacterium]